MHNKIYSDSFSEVKRKSIWLENLNLIALHNQNEALGKETFKLESNKFSDRTYEEFLIHNTGFVGMQCNLIGPLSRATTSNQTTTTTKSTSISSNTISDKSLPSAVDYRNTKHVLDIKDQGFLPLYF